MTGTERLSLVAPCGIDCGNCRLQMCKDDPRMMDAIVAMGIPREKLPCAGCRGAKGACPVIGGRCDTFSCVSGKKVEFCFQCDEFPCPLLNPAADRADVLPHNTKVFNLCTIKRLGVEGFVRESALIEKKYFKGKMVIGKGPEVPR